MSKSRKHSHYFKDVSGIPEVDVYRVLDLFQVTHPCAQHAIKKLLVPGNRGGGKTSQQDVEEALDTLNRWLEMIREDQAPTVSFQDEPATLQSLADLLVAPR